MAKSKRAKFNNFTHIDKNEPMLNTEFWSWLDKQEKQSIDNFIETLKTYMGSKGFDINKHILPDGQANIHRTIFHHYWWTFHHKKA